MAFNFGNSGNNAIGSPGGAAGIGVKIGPDLEDIQTEGLAFLALHGETKLQLLSTPWPADSLPPPTSSLLSISSQRGLIAAAGPDGVVGATTESVRKAFQGENNGESNLVPFQPQLRLPIQMRLSQLAFSADGKYLVLSAETGGGLAVYEVDALLQGSTEPSFQLATNGKSLRILLPNPTIERAELFAVITVDGDLFVANMNARSLVAGSNGQVLQNGVSCVSWSTKGKQLVAGLGDGTVHQLTPEGVHKGLIPRPPHVTADHHVSSITWLENDVFLLIHTPSQFDITTAPQSFFHLVTRSPDSKEVLFQKISDPAAPFGLNRSPPHHFILRLREFPPNLQDLLILASTASTDIGLFSRSKMPLTSNKPAEKITGVFTMTEMSNDSGRAQLPITADLRDTSPIGLALDLSSKETVPRPIPGDEMDESATPLPALMVLNNEGVLASWWIVYTDSIRQKMAYPGLITGQETLQAVIPIPGQKPAATSTSSGGFPQSSFGSSTSANPISGAFGNASNAPAFGSPSLPASQATGAFGAPSSLGAKPSLWGTPLASTQRPQSGGTFGTPAFGSTASLNTTPAFGAPSFGKPAFGVSSFGAGAPLSFGSSAMPGSRPSPWGSPGSASAFGQSSSLGKVSSAFGSQAQSSTGTTPSPGGFASFASKGGFAAAADAAKPAHSIFGAQPSTTSFATLSSGKSSGSPFGGVSKSEEKAQNSVFGSTTFFPGTFSGEGVSAESGKPTPTATGETPFLRGKPGTASGTAEMTDTMAIEATLSKEADMDTTEDMKGDDPAKESSAAPVTSPVGQGSLIFGLNELASSIDPAVGGMLSLSPQAAKPQGTNGFPSTSAVRDTTIGISKLADQSSSSNGASKPPTSGAIIQPLTTLIVPGASSKAKDGQESDEALKTSIKAPIQAPLPPETTSKTSYATGESSTSSIEADAPLPPDFLPKSAVKAIEALALPSTTIPSQTIGLPSFTLLKDDPQPLEDGDDIESDFGTEDGSRHIAEVSDEDSGEDVTNDLSPISGTTHTPGLSPQSSFGGQKSRHADNSLFGNIQEPLKSGQSRSLFGEVNHFVPVLPPPKVPLSPRSPSPVRNAVPGRLLRPDPSRSVSAPGTASALLASQGRMGRTATPQSSTKSVMLLKVEEERRAIERARQKSEECRALDDGDEARMQDFLASEVKGTRTLDEFVAHSDYVSNSSPDSIPAQVEVVYRDMNSMIDTLGLNARAVKSFIKGHTEQYKEQGRTREDLEDGENWVLVEIEDLSAVVERTLGRKLQSDRLRDVVGKLEACADLLRDLARLRARCDDIKKAMATHTDPMNPKSTYGQPLSAEQVAQQHDLRKEYTKFQGLLSEAEEAFTMLKAKLVSRAAFEGKADGGAGPTVDAVLRTIRKMTGMAEKRSGDIDVLEGKMRRLQLTPNAGNRAGSPFATPYKGLSSVYGAPEAQHDFGGKARGLQSSLISSRGSPFAPSPSRRKLSGYTAEEKDHLRLKLARRKEVTDRLRAALERTGTHVKLMGDEE